jgi:hypothetical protein
MLMTMLLCYVNDYVIYYVTVLCYCIILLIMLLCYVTDYVTVLCYFIILMIMLLCYVSRAPFDCERKVDSFF